MYIFPETALEKLGYTDIIEAAADLCRTEVGNDALLELVPSTDEQVIGYELHLTGEMLGILESQEALPLDELADILPALDRARTEGAMLDPKALLNIAHFLRACRVLRSFFSKRQEYFPAVSSEALRLTEEKALEQALFEAISEFGEIKDSASPALRKIRAQINAKKNQIRASLAKFARVAQKHGASGDEGMTLRDGRLVIPIKAEFKRQFNGLVHDVSATGQTVYFEPADTMHHNNDLRTLELEEVREIERILRALTAQIRPSVPLIAKNVFIVSKIDMLHAKAQLCSRLEATIPEVARFNPLELSACQNPHLKLVRTHHSRTASSEPIVPLTLSLTPEEYCLMITGPNAGGKSVALKTVGLCVLLAQSGFGIPSPTPARLPIFSSLFVDMGDDQSVENDLSTFSSRLHWMAKSEEKVMDESLILIDEAGAGTDPDEGSALYEAFLDTMMARKARAIVTTHHGRLKVFAHDHESAVNGSMIFDQVALKPTYRFQKGIPGSSYAFEIAARMNLSSSLISEARRRLGKKSTQMEFLISDLEREREQLRSDQLAVLTERRKNEQELEKLKTKQHTLTQEREALKAKTLAEAKAFIQQANARIEQAVEAIRTGKASKESIKEARSMVGQVKETYREKVSSTEREQKRSSSNEHFMVGDWVTIADSSTAGEIVEIKGKSVTIESNGLRIVTKMNKLHAGQKPKPSKKTPTFSSSTTQDWTSAGEGASMRLDIRGKRVEEVDALVIPFLDKAVLKGLQEVEIVHGKGTGALRHYVHEFLAKDSRIEQFEDAHWDQGGPGCTVVQLKK